jgi:hypothetical protein
MALIRPRLTDHHNVLKTQAELDFAIPFLNEDLPLYVDPFLLFKSPSQQDQALHTAITNSFNHLNHLIRNKHDDQALSILIATSECDEVGLGLSRRRTGHRISIEQASEIIELFKRIPSYRGGGFAHFEEIQLYVNGISKDRISDFSCNFLKSFLVDFTYDQCQLSGIPTTTTKIETFYNYQKNRIDSDVTVSLPVHPTTGKPLLLVPRRWLRFSPWINFEDYFKDYCPRDKIFQPGEPESHIKVLNYNRDNYGAVDAYVKEKVRTALDCKNDPLFKQIPIVSAKRKLDEIKSLPTGKSDNADRQYEDAASELLSSLLYPHLDFADTQTRTDSGVLIRDLVFYNNRSSDFLGEIFKDYDSRQLVMELKNVKAVESGHLNQLNRYLSHDFGRFGVLVTRNPIPKSIFRNTIDLWSGQRRCIVSLDDSDIDLMVNVFESKQRTPIEVLKKKYVEFKRSCPS